MTLQRAHAIANRIRGIQDALDQSATWTPTEVWHAWPSELRRGAWNRPIQNGVWLLGTGRECQDFSWWQFEVVMRNFGFKLDWSASPYASAHLKYLNACLVEVDDRIARGLPTRNGRVVLPAGKHDSWSGTPIHDTSMAPMSAPLRPLDWSLPDRPVASNLPADVGWAFVQGVHPDAVELVVATPRAREPPSAGWSARIPVTRSVPSLGVESKTSGRGRYVDVGREEHASYVAGAVTSDAVVLGPG